MFEVHRFYVCQLDLVEFWNVQTSFNSLEMKAGSFVLDHVLCLEILT